MRRLFIFIMLIPYLANAQEQEGIRFENDLSWQEIKARGQAEGKPIFLDCYATWCGPCKRMDDSVYGEEKVGAFMNAHFLSVKIQLDSSGKDNERIKKWYSDARMILTNYGVSELPTYLFLSPDGKLLNRGSGYLEDSLFLKMADRSLNPESQYYSRIEKYRSGQLNYADMPGLAILANKNKDKSTAQQIARDYWVNWLAKRENIEEVFGPSHIEFLRAFPPRDLISNSTLFRWIFDNGPRVDQLMQRKGYAQSTVDFTITNEEVKPRLESSVVQPGDNPEWRVLYRVIRKKYGRGYAERIILAAQLKWYKEKKDWPEIAKFTVIKIEKQGLDTAGFGKYFTNNTIYEIVFAHSNNKKELRKASNWMKIIIDANPELTTGVDTYANLLYKAGDIKKGIIWEQRAVDLENANAVKQNIIPNKEFQETLTKMKRGEPTW